MKKSKHGFYKPQSMYMNFTLFYYYFGLRLNQQLNFKHLANRTRLATAAIIYHHVKIPKFSKFICDRPWSGLGDEEECMLSQLLSQSNTLYCLPCCWCGRRGWKDRWYIHIISTGVVENQMFTISKREAFSLWDELPRIDKKNISARGDTHQITYSYPSHSLLSCS
jgi:hypothetical protein